ncbi:MAG: hypothetical protein JNK35_00245 [Phycisphaerae bacterium]|nr:hypothetical protein [Phycisphaerae bacterium]
MLEPSAPQPPVSPPTDAKSAPRESRKVTPQTSSPTPPADLLELVRPAQPAALPKPAGTAPSPSIRAADAAWLAEKESDATSKRRVAEYRAGTVHAGAGVEIYRITRPQTTTLTRMMGAARNPTFDIVFNRRGEVARVLRTRPSGNDALDNNIESAIFFWRARGKEFDALPDSPDATITIRLTFLLSSA